MTIRAIVIAVTFSALALIADSTAGTPIVEHIGVRTPTNPTLFNGFEDTAPSDCCHPTTYVEDGIHVEQIEGIGNSGIWSSYAESHDGYQGLRAWYSPSDIFGFTIITLEDGSDFQDIGFIIGSGFHPPEFEVDFMFELYNDGALVLDGRFAFFIDSVTSYFIVLGGGFDEIRARTGLTSSPNPDALCSNPTSFCQALATSFDDGTPNALVIDSIAVDEPLFFSVGKGDNLSQRQALDQRASECRARSPGARRHTGGLSLITGIGLRARNSGSFPQRSNQLAANRSI